MTNTKIISFINMKGGVGKTTLSVNIGYTLATHFDKEVLLVDMDPQMNATQYTLTDTQVKERLENANRTVFGILRDDFDFPSISKESSEEIQNDFITPIVDGFDIIPSHLKIMTLNISNSPFKLKNYLFSIRNDYDIVIIDSPPTISAYTTASLLASTDYLVPMRTDFLSLFGLPLLETFIQMKIEKSYDTRINFLGIVFSMVDSRLKIYKEVKKQLLENENWRNKLFENEMKQKTQIAMALIQENREKGTSYISELGDDSIRENMISITEEFIQKVRI